ncbi:hypothetical protein Tco_1259172 [Tanacetum coccineum]
MGEVYERMDNMVGEIIDLMKNVYNSYIPEVEKIVLARWEKMTIPLHCLGFELTLKFYDKTYHSTKAPGGIPRKPPKLDKEVTNGVKDAFKRISENDEETQMLRAQYARFHMKKGLYARPEAQIDAITMDLIDVLIPAKPATTTELAVPEHTVPKTYENNLPKNHAYIDVEAEAIHMILSGIRDDIYSTFDACTIAKEMWIAIERLQ